MFFLLSEESSPLFLAYNSLAGEGWSLQATLADTGCAKPLEQLQTISRFQTMSLNFMYPYSTFHHVHQVRHDEGVLTPAVQV